MGRLLRVDPIVVTGILISVALAVGMDVWGGASDVESLLAGLIGTNITLVLDSIARTEGQFRLRRNIESVEWLGSAITPILEHTREIAEKYPASAAVLVEARRKFRELATDLDAMRHGQISRPGDDSEDLIRGADSCQARLEAITNILPDGAGSTEWWASDIGQRYWQANLAAIKRGVLVSRVFIYAEETDKLRTLVADQERAGVKVRLLPCTTIHRARHRNIAIFDDRTAWEAKMSARGEIIENLYYVDDLDVERLRQVFRHCQAKARDVD